MTSNSTGTSFVWATEVAEELIQNPSVDVATAFLLFGQKNKRGYELISSSRVPVRLVFVGDFPPPGGDKLERQWR